MGLVAVAGAVVGGVAALEGLRTESAALIGDEPCVNNRSSLLSRTSFGSSAPRVTLLSFCDFTASRVGLLLLTVSDLVSDFLVGEVRAEEKNVNVTNNLTPPSIVSQSASYLSTHRPAVAMALGTVIASYTEFIVTPLL